MSLPNISLACREATRLCLANATTGFNALVLANAQAFGVKPFTVDFTADSSIQYFNAAADPDDLEDTTPFKYPVVFHYSDSSVNAHEQMSVGFAGTVVQVLSFYFTDENPKVTSVFERIGDLVEAAVNALFADGNWPQNFGANAVCGQYPMKRAPLDDGGKSSRQGFTFRLMFNVVSN